MMSKVALNPETLFNSLQYGFSQITVGQGQRIVTVSGQVGWDETGRMNEGADLQTQTMKVFSNLDSAMRAAGGTLDDILSLRIYIVADVMDDSAAIRETLQHFFPTNPPTTNWIGVPRLANRAFLVEVEALAILD